MSVYSSSFHRSTLPVITGAIAAIFTRPQPVNGYKKSYQQIADKLGRTQFAIRCRAVVLKIARSNKWGHKDIARLRQLWKKGYTAAQIAEIIGKTTTSICHQIKRQKRDFGLPQRPNPNKWSQEQTAYLMKHYKNQSIQQIADRLGRKPGSISSKARKLGLIEPAYQVWTKSETKFLIKYYPQWTALKIAQKLGKKLLSVQARVCYLGLKKK
jgi:hypothetical protein